MNSFSLLKQKQQAEKANSLLLAVVVLLLVVLAILTFVAHVGHSVLVELLLLHHFLGSLLVRSVGALAQHNDLVLCLRVLPPAKDQQMRSDCGRGVTKADGGRLARYLPFFHDIVSVDQIWK